MIPLCLVPRQDLQDPLPPPPPTHIPKPIEVCTESQTDLSLIVVCPENTGLLPTLLNKCCSLNSEARNFVTHKF